MNKTVANTAFLIAFPMFFFGNVAMSAGLLPSFGVFSIAAAVSLAYFLTFGGENLKNTIVSAPKLGLVYLSLFFICFSWMIFPYLFGWSIEIPATIQIAILLGSWVSLFSIGGFIDLHKPYMRYSLWLCFFVMAAVSFYFIDLNYLTFNVQRVFGGKDVSTYQEMTRSGMVVSLALLSSLRGGVVHRLAWSMAFFPFVFSLGARSEFFGMILAVFAFEAVRGIRRVTNWLVIATLLASVAVGLVMKADDLANSRQAAVLNLSKDASWKLRNEYQQIAEEQIMSDPFWGVPGGHFEGGEAGAYSHNALSAWVSFGLPGFVMYLVANIASAAACTIVVITRKEVGWRWRFAFYLNISALALVLIAKPVFWPMPALGWGVLMGAIMRERVISRHNKSVHPVAA